MELSNKVKKTTLPETGLTAHLAAGMALYLRTGGDTTAKGGHCVQENEEPQGKMFILRKSLEQSTKVRRGRRAGQMG